MLVAKNNFIPIVFPPGAGGHFFWQMLSTHPKVMPMGKDQTMQKLFLYKNIAEQSNRIIRSITSNHNDWQKLENHDYYIAPPDYSKQEHATWTLDNNNVKINTGDHYFFEKIHNKNNVYSMVVHNTEQFPAIKNLNKVIQFENFNKHVNNSKKKISHIKHISSTWDADIPNSFKIDVDKFFYDWNHASVELYLIYEYLGLWLDTDTRLTIEKSWNAYRSIH